MCSSRASQSPLPAAGDPPGPGARAAISQVQVTATGALEPSLSLQQPQRILSILAIL